MEQTKIINLPILSSRIGLGTWAMGGSLWGEANEEESIATIHRALDLGINFIDTAPGYGFGASEEVIGKALKLCGCRDQVILATKFGLNLESSTNVFRDSRKESILKEVDASLKRLQTEYIDVYQVHWPDPHIPQEETAEILQGLVEQGKIKTIGVSNYSLLQLQAFNNTTPIQVFQPPYNLFEREAEPLIEYSKKNHISVVGYSSLCRGLLTGLLQEDTEFEDLRKNFDPKFKMPYYPQYLLCVGRLKQWTLDKFNKSLTALAIRWSLDKGIDIALWGARKPEELDPVQDILDWKLTIKDLEEIDNIIKETILEPIGPQFMSPPIRIL